jgi:hypothetical protein
VLSVVVRAALYRGSEAQPAAEEWHWEKAS